MLPAFMGLAIQVVSLVIIVLLLNAKLGEIRRVRPYMTHARQLPARAIAGPVVVSWIMVTTAISIAFYAVMRVFAVPLPHSFWNVVAVIGLMVLAMESISLFFSLNIRSGYVLVALYTLIVLPAFMYSGFLVPLEQMPSFPRMAGGWFPLRYYLQALYGVFNRGASLSGVATYLIYLSYFTGAFLTLSIISVALGSLRRNNPTFPAGGQAVAGAPSKDVES